MLIDRLEYPFLLPYTYLMNDDAIYDELLNPPGLSDHLLALGLVQTELTLDEFMLAGTYMNQYSKPSKYDCIALAIAKSRHLILLTGDGALRKAAQEQGVEVMGTIGVLDQLYQKEFINHEDYLYCLKELLKHNGTKVRLPKNELEERIQKLEEMVCI